VLVAAILKNSPGAIRRLMLTPEMIFRAAKDQTLRIGIGCGENKERVEDSARIASGCGYGMPVLFDNAADLVRALKDGSVDAAVRGDLDAKDALAALKKDFELPKVMRLVLLQMRGSGIFFMAPVGVDEGWTVPEKLELATYGSKLVARLGETPKVAVLSGGRSNDIGRHARVDQSILDGQEVVRLGKQAGLDIEDCQILIEEALKERNIIIAPDGISGNLIFRTLHLVDGGRSMGAPVINLQKVFIDTSRSKASYVDSIALASALAGGKPIKAGRPGGHPASAGGHPGGHPPGAGGHPGKH
jgi:putative methanogen marker protein 4